MQRHIKIVRKPQAVLRQYSCKFYSSSLLYGSTGIFGFPVEAKSSCYLWRFTTSTSTSARRRRTSTATTCKSLNIFGALPGTEECCQRIWQLCCHNFVCKGPKDCALFANGFVAKTQICPGFFCQHFCLLGQLNLGLSLVDSSFYRSGFFPLTCLSSPRWTQNLTFDQLMMDKRLQPHNKWNYYMNCFRNQKLVLLVRPSMASFILQHSGFVFTSQSISLSNHIIWAKPPQLEACRREREKLSQGT